MVYVNLDKGAKTDQDKKSLMMPPYPVTQAKMTHETPMAQASLANMAQITATPVEKHFWVTQLRSTGQ